MSPLRLSIFGLFWLVLPLTTTAYSPDVIANNSALSEPFHFGLWLIMGLLVLIMGALSIHFNRLNSQPYRFDDQESHLSASIGISLFPNDGEQADILLKHADTAMYDIK